MWIAGAEKHVGIQKYQPRKTFTTVTTDPMPHATHEPTRELSAHLASQRTALEHATATLHHRSLVRDPHLQELFADLQVALKLHEDVVATIRDLRETARVKSIRTDALTGLGHEFAMAESGCG